MAEAVRIGAYALCVDDRGRLLMSRVSPNLRDAGQWTIPGGGVDWGEAPGDAVRRELFEETGLRAREVREVAGIYSKVYAEPPPLHHVGIVYRVVAGDGELVPETGGSTDACAWVSRAEAGDLPLTPLGAFGADLAWPSA